MKEIYSEIDIEAPAKIVWDILTDFEDFPRWNPFIREILGDVREGSYIEVTIKPPNSNGMNFKPKIKKYTPGERITWLGVFYIPKLVDGEHSLIIKKIDDKKVLFIQKEEFNGLLVPLISGLLKDTKSGFELMNKALKDEAENKYSKIEKLEN